MAKRFFAVFRMDMVNLFKNPVLVGYNTVFAGLSILVMGFLTGGDYAHSSDAFQYYAVTMLVYGMFNGAMTATNIFMERDIKRPNLRILYSPAGSFPVYFSKTLASFVFDYALHAMLVVALVPVLHLSLGARPALFYLLMAPVELAAASFGTFFCCLMHTEEAASTLLSTVVSLLCVVGGTFFPMDGMGGALALVSRFSPAKWVNEAFFLLCCDNSARLFAPVALGGLFLSALLTLGCRATFRTEDYL